MPGFAPLRRADMPTLVNVLGVSVTRLPTHGAVLTVVRGRAGDVVPAHGYSRGAITFVVEGTVEVDGQQLQPGDAGSYEPGSGFYGVRFVTDGAYVVARTADDELTLPDLGETSAAHPDA